MITPMQILEYQSELTQQVHRLNIQTNDQVESDTDSFDFSIFNNIHHVILDGFQDIVTISGTAGFCRTAAPVATPPTRLDGSIVA